MVLWWVVGGRTAVVLLGCFLQNLYNTARSIPVLLSSNFFSIHLAFMFCFNLAVSTRPLLGNFCVRSDFHITHSLSMAVHSVASHVLISFSVYYLPRLRAPNVYRFNERKRFHAGKGKKIRRYTAQTIMGANYADNLTLLEKYIHSSRIPAYSLERAAGGIGLYVNIDKTECMCFNQRGNISTLNSGPLKLMDKLTYFGSSVTSIKNDIINSLYFKLKYI